jgi:putative hydrolase of the HAD superfamily
MPAPAVAFDLDYTLVVPARDRQTLLNEATTAVGVDGLDRADYLAAHRKHVASETRAPIFAELLSPADPEPERLARAYREAINDALVPIPGVEDLLAALRERGPLGLVTDGPVHAQRAKLETLGWTDRFDAVVITGDLPAPKPDGRAFATLADGLGVDQEAIVFVGDHPRADVQGAAAAGMTAVQVLTEEFEPDPAADALVERDALATELPRLLERLTDGPTVRR